MCFADRTTARYDRLPVSDDIETITCADGSPAARGPEPASRVLLVFLGTEPTALTLPDADEVTVGRGTRADVQIDGSSLSRIHARFRFGVHVTLEDMGSSNGTFVGGIRLAPRSPVVIAPGTTLQLGHVMAVLHVGASTPTILGTSDGSVAGARALEHALLRIASTELSVLIIGETGVGKGTFARRIHDQSRRAGGPFVVVRPSSMANVFNSGGLAETRGGTLVLDELGDIDPRSQRLVVEAVDALREAPRLVGTSSRDLRGDAESMRMLPELYHRVAGVSIVLPPLRARVHEIAGLAQTIAADLVRTMGRPPPVFAPDALAVLERHPWPGNVRELAARIEQALALSRGRVLTATHFADLEPAERAAAEIGVGRLEAGRGVLREARERGEYQQIIEALRTCRGNQTRAAQALGISRSTLLSRLEKYGVPRPRKS